MRESFFINNSMQSLELKGPASTLEKDIPDKFQLFIQYNNGEKTYI